MIRICLLFVGCIALSISGLAQEVLDTVQLSKDEIPEGYKFSKKLQCISVQACTFYENPGMYASILGEVKTKSIQNVESKKDKGSVMYFEFEENMKNEEFLTGLLWGGSKPSKEHPEEYQVCGKILVIWSFNLGSPIIGLSQGKVRSSLKCGTK